MKKIIFLMLILLLGTACSRVSRKSELIEKNEKTVTFYNYYDNWELKEAEIELNQLMLEEKERSLLMQKLTTRRNNKEKFNETLNIVEQALKSNDFDLLEKYVTSNIINEIKLRELKKNDYSRVKFYFGKKKFYKTKAETLMLANYLEETMYVDLKFKLIDDKEWQLVSFKERR